ncbi:MAG TPA: DUF692 domain-containing protein [Steroidobacteraceae bacterium]|nr:DUF692 domain-containing protein [Steroidobacteraceae bacterium]
MPPAAGLAGTAGSIPARAGIGLRAPHYEALLRERPDVGWLEAHSENYFGAGGAQLRTLERLRIDYPIALHGVGLSLGSSDPLDVAHLRKLARLVERIAPVFVSEHLSWSSVGQRHANDLLPLPYTEEALRHLIERVGQVQDTLGRRVLVENVSSYVEFSCSEMPEWQFLAALAHEADCGILLDVNNIFVSAHNHGWNALQYLQGIPASAVREMHLAGHTARRVGGRELLVDTHSTQVSEAVWRLYEAAVRRFPRAPTLIEWDSDIPPLEVLCAQAARADRCREASDAQAA